MPSRPVRWCKTPQAWSMLAQHARLNRSVYALLLLANGQRSEQELSMLLGTDVSALARDLHQQGCLQPSAQGFLDAEWDSEWEGERQASWANGQAGAPQRHPAPAPLAHRLAELTASV